MRHAVTSLVLALLCGAVQAQAESSIALACPVCHGAPDAARPPGAVPTFYGRASRDIAHQLRGFRDGSREGSAMPRLAHALTDDEIETLAHRYGAAD